MTVGEGVSVIEQMAEKTKKQAPEIYVGMARAGSDNPVVIAGGGDKLKSADFGEPLHVMAVPATLHMMEKEYLENFADL